MANVHWLMDIDAVFNTESHFIEKNLNEACSLTIFHQCQWLVSILYCRYVNNTAGGRVHEAFCTVFAIYWVCNYFRIEKLKKKYLERIIFYLGGSTAWLIRVVSHHTERGFPAVSPKKKASFLSLPLRSGPSPHTLILSSTVTLLRFWKENTANGKLKKALFWEIYFSC